MKFSKKLTVGIAALAIAVLLTACDNNSENNSENSQNSQANHAAELTDTIDNTANYGGCC